MILMTGKFENYKNHHSGWFRVLRFGESTVECWFGKNWINLNWRA